MEKEGLSCAGEHEIYCCGARVLIKNGKVKVLSEPRIAYCPLHGSLYGTSEITKESVKRSIDTKIRNLGFCCEHRVFNNSLIVPYGASEMISTCMKMGMLECAVTVCEGAGTVITDNSDLVQEMGARLTGIVRTSPIASIIKHIKENGGFILDETSALIDQAEGVAKAAELGYRSVAATVASFKSDAIDGIRGVQKDRGIEVVVFSICNTCATETDVDRILAGADIVCASASRLIRERVGPKANMQLGVAIPLFALTEFGKKLILGYLTEFDDSIVAFRTRKLPYIVEGRGPRLRE